MSSAPIDIDSANDAAFRRIVDAEPVLVDVAPAGEAIAELQDMVLLHAGPPIGWKEMCAPMRAAILGAMRYEGWAANDAEAETLAGSGEVRLLPNLDVAVVGPMAGVTTGSMPVFLFE